MIPSLVMRRYIPSSRWLILRNMRKLNRRIMIKIGLLVLFILFIGVMGVMSAFMEKDEYIHDKRQMEDGDQ
jgi:hypothetical protein